MTSDIPKGKITGAKVEIERDHHDELLEAYYWEKLRGKLLKTIFSWIAVVSAVGALGLNSLVDSKIASYTEKSTSAFQKKAEENLFYSKLLALMNSRYSVYLNTFRQDVTYLREVSKIRKRQLHEFNRNSKINGTHNDVLSVELEILLRQLSVREDFGPIFDQKIDPLKMIKGNYNSIFTEGTDVIIEKYTSSGSNYSLSSHPIRTGSLGNEILDIKFRLVSMHAFKLTFQEIEAGFLSTGNHVGSFNIPYYGAHGYYQKHINLMYKKHAESIAKHYLGEKELKLYLKHYDYYNFSSVGV